MALPVIEDVYRCTFNLTAGGDPSAHNVVHVLAPSGTEESVAAMLDDFLSDPPGSNPFEIVSSTYLCSTVTVLALDGVSAGLEQEVATPLSGGSDGQRIFNIAGVVSFHTAQRGSRGRGRVFLGPITEGVWTGAALEAVPMGASRDGWALLQAAIQAEFVGGDLVVASYTHGDANPVTSIVGHVYGASQARRLYATR